MKKYKLWALMQVVILLVGSVSCSKDENDEPTLKNDITKDGIFNGLPNDEMVFVKGGTFTMGATEEQIPEAPDDDEYPAHEVTVGDLYIGKYEVTQELWEYVM